MDLEQDYVERPLIQTNGSEEIKSGRAKSLHELSFDPDDQNIVDFLEEFESCIKKGTSLDAVKVCLFDFIPNDDSDDSSKFFHEKGYLDCKKYMITKYIDRFVKKRYELINEQFDESDLYKFVQTKIKVYKKYYPDRSDKDVIQDILSLHLNPNVSSAFYTYDMHKNYTDFLKMAKFFQHLAQSYSTENDSDDVSFQDLLNRSEFEKNYVGKNRIFLDVNEETNSMNLDTDVESLHGEQTSECIQRNELARSPSNLSTDESSITEQSATTLVSSSQTGDMKMSSKRKRKDASKIDSEDTTQIKKLRSYNKKHKGV